MLGDFSAEVVCVFLGSAVVEAETTEENVCEIVYEAHCREE